MFDSNFGDGFECLKIVCRAGGVARTVNEDRFCLRGDSRFDLIGCHAEVLRGCRLNDAVALHLQV